MCVPFRVKDDIYIDINNGKRKQIYCAKCETRHFPPTGKKCTVNVRTLLKLILNLVLKNCTKLIPGSTGILMKGHLWCKV